MRADSPKGTSKAVVLSAILHLGIVGFLALAVVPCSFYEQVFETLHLPADWNPITCTKPVALQGEIIEAELVGITGAPPPKHTQTKPVPNTVPPPPSIPPPPSVETPKIKTLPPPPEHPDTKDQEKVVAEGIQKAEDAKKEQEEKQRQRAAELDAQAAKHKQEEQKKIDELFAKMDAADQQTKKADSKAKQAKQQMEDLKNAQDNGLDNVPYAAQRQTGANGPDAGLRAQYLAAIQNTLKQNWVGPDNMPTNQQCLLHIVQLQGGQVVSAKVDSSCPFDEAGRKSVEDAAMRANQLPYKGFESVFSRNVDMFFKP
ncbi:cell envelope integrity protein TolA [Dyella telluris]|uniref:TonB C-terminal domain-containing protein n=1 Tax=Dyella telluris TaxID=2763498 RepID=A0A7G8Q078_9GAMM|nr:cell envelope integrity protein TolA [Dyella telluris]QNK00186.1 TonB C-terminal domain-containing protein [Dyella telluris]